MLFLGTFEVLHCGSAASKVHFHVMFKALYRGSAASKVLFHGMFKVLLRLGGIQVALSRYV